MSDIFDHEADAWDQAIFHPEILEDDDGYYMGRKYNLQNRARIHNERGQKMYDDYWNEENLQPDFQQLVVSKLHAQTQKAVCVSGTVYFDRPYRGLKSFEFLADWLPLSKCLFTGDAVRVPQWIIRSRWQQRTRRTAIVDIKIPF